MDTICIDQNDLIEKAMQVQLMGTILKVQQKFSRVLGRIGIIVSSCLTSRSIDDNILEDKSSVKDRLFAELWK
jgi:hypothetical protein